MTVQHVSPLLARCHCVIDHRPQPMVLHSHHVVPMGGTWNGPDVPENRVTICPTCHTSTHALIDLYVALGREPTRAEMQIRWGHIPNRQVQVLAAQAWAQRPAHPTRTS